MANANVNKVVYGNTTLIDLTGDTVTPQTLLQGATAHNAAGEQITGTYAGGDDLMGCRIHFASDGSIIYTSDDGTKTIQDFPAGTVTRERFYNAAGTLTATRTTTVDDATGDIVETVVTA